jgi:hypothetical protein
MLLSDSEDNNQPDWAHCSSVPFNINVRVCAEDWVDIPSFVLEDVGYIKPDGHFITGRDLRDLVASAINRHTELIDPRQMRLIVHYPPGAKVINTAAPVSNSALLVAIHLAEAFEVEVRRKRRGKKGAGNGFSKAWKKTLMQFSHYHVQLRGCRKGEGLEPEFRYQTLLSLLRLHAENALVLCSSPEVAVGLQQRLSDAQLSQSIVVAGAGHDHFGKCCWRKTIVSGALAARVVVVYDEFRDGVPLLSSALQEIEAFAIIHHLSMFGQSWGLPLVQQLRDLDCNVREIQSKQLLEIDREFAIWYHGQGHSLAAASDQMRDDREVVLAAVSHGSSFHYISEELRADRIVNLTALAHGCRDRHRMLRDILEEVKEVSSRFGLSLPEAADKLLCEKAIQLEVISKDPSLVELVVGCYSLAGNELTRFKITPDAATQETDGRSYLLNQIGSNLSLHKASLQRVVLPSGLLLTCAETAPPLELLKPDFRNICSRIECVRCGCANEFDVFGDRICWCDSCHKGCKKM